MDNSYAPYNFPTRVQTPAPFHRLFAVRCPSNTSINYSEPFELERSTHKYLKKHARTKNEKKKLVHPSASYWSATNFVFAMFEYFMSCPTWRGWMRVNFRNTRFVYYWPPPRVVRKVCIRNFRNVFVLRVKREDIVLTNRRDVELFTRMKILWCRIAQLSDGWNFAIAMVRFRTQRIRK